MIYVALAFSGIEFDFSAFKILFVMFSRIDSCLKYREFL